MARAGGRSRNGNESMVVGFLKTAFRFLKMAEFEILFVLFFIVAFIIFKDLVSFSLIRLFLFLLCLEACCLNLIGSDDIDRNDNCREPSLLLICCFGIYLSAVSCMLIYFDPRIRFNLSIC